MEKCHCWSNSNFILGPLLFLTYINGLCEGPSTNVKLFADDTPLFSMIHDNQTSANNHSKGLERYI